MNLSLIDTDSQKKRARRAYHSRIVAAFVEHTLIADVAKTAKVSLATAKRWKAVPEWWAEVERARGDLLTDTINRLRNKLPLIADRLANLALNPVNPLDGIAVRAGLATFDIFAKLSERGELEQRLSFLELNHHKAEAARIEAARGSAHSARAGRISLLRPPLEPDETVTAG